MIWSCRRHVAGKTHLLRSGNQVVISDVMNVNIMLFDILFLLSLTFANNAC